MSEQPQQGRMQRRDEEDSALDLRQSDPDELHERPEPDPANELDDTDEWAMTSRSEGKARMSSPGSHIPRPPIGGTLRLAKRQAVLGIVSHPLRAGIPATDSAEA
jgi:hypothetical protein